MTDKIVGFGGNTSASEQFMREDLMRSWLTPEDMPYGVAPLNVKDGVARYKILYGQKSGGYWRIRSNRKENKYISPKGQTAQSFMPRDFEGFRQANIVAIVEGEKKQVAWELRTGVPAIGIGGCWNWCEDSADGESKQIRLEILEGLNPNKTLIVCIDGDWRTNTDVQRSVATLALELEAIGVRARFPDFGDIKGVDDWIVAKYKRGEEVPAREEVLKDILRLPQIPIETLEAAKSWALATLAKFNTTHVDLSDRGNATLWLRLTGKNNVRYMEDVKKWAQWNKEAGQWQMLSPLHMEHANVVALYYEKRAQKLRELAEAMTGNSDDDRARRVALEARAKAMAKWATTKCSSVPGRKAFLEDAAGRKGVCVMRSAFDTHADLLAVANGVVDLRTGELRVERQSDMVLTHSPTRYRMEEPSGQWAQIVKKFVREITAVAHGKPDARRECWLKRRLGVALRGRNALDALELWTGTGANGKTVLSKLVSAALGDYAATIPAAVILTSRANRDAEAASPFLISTIGKRILFAAETSDTAHLEEAKVKQLTGGDTIAIRGNYQNAAEYDVTWTLCLLTQNLPHVAQGDLALWDRLAVFPFLCRWHRENAPHIAEEKDLPPASLEIRDGMVSAEAVEAREWILWWMVQGSVEWEDEGLGAAPADIEEKRGEYQESEDKLSHWLEDSGYRLDPEGKVASGLVYSNFKMWCATNGGNAPTQTVFTQRLKARFADEITPVKTNGTRYLKGLSMQ